MPRGKSTGRIRSPPRKRVRGKLRCGFESHGFRCQRGCVADPSWNSSRAHGPRGRHRPGVPEIRVRFPVSPLQRGWRSTVPWFSGDNTRVTTGKRWFESIRDHSPLPRKGWGGKTPPDNGVSPVGRTQEGHRPPSAPSLSVLVVQWKHAVLSSRRPWVRIPSGTLSKECGLETPLQTMCSTWWWNWQTRSTQNAEPTWRWEFESPSGHCRWAGAQLAFIRPAGPVRARDLQLKGCVEVELRDVSLETRRTLRV